MRGHVKFREISSGPAEWRRRQPGRRTKNRSTSLFPLMIRQPVSLDTRFGDQIASLTTGGVKSRTRGGVGRVAPAGWKL